MPETLVKPESVEKRVIAAVMRDAIATGNIKESIEMFGHSLSPERKAILSQLSDIELAALRSIGSKHLDLPGDKLA